MNIERELRQVIVRREPADGFAERVIERLGEPRPIRPALRRRQPLRTFRRFAAAAAVAFAILWARDRVSAEREAMGRRASRDVMTALRIASRKVNVVRQGVLDIEHEEQ